MKISILAIMVLLICTITSYGQTTYTIKGTTIDTLTKAKLTTTVTILNAKDSILQTFTHTGADGSFSLPISKPGIYLLWVTCPDYASYEEKFTISAATPTHNFGNINIQDRAKLLQEVVIKGEATAIKIKGDTTVYNARAFVIQPNDKVEDLLKQLPDVQVDKDGKITAQGEKVPKVLVDGEEFFGDDPLLVTRNLRADMVDKVEIYNKKSDQAAFTGIDDGKTTKTINIKLREDKKTGVFGKVLGGLGNDGYYDGQAMFNKFKGKYKLSVYGTASNIGKNGLGFEDASKLGTTSTTMVDFGDGAVGYSISTGDDYDNSTYSGRGIPHAATAGAHYDTKWNADKESINTNYRISSLSLNTTQDQDQQANYTNLSTHRVSSQNTYNHTFRQKADMIYQNNFNANTTLKFTADGTIKSTDNTLDLTATNENLNTGSLLSKEVRSEKTNGDVKLFNTSFLFNKKFKKDRRTLSWNVSEAFSQTDSKRFLNSVITTPAKNPADTTLNQYQPVHSLSSVLNSNITYSEPLTAKFSAIFNYGFGITTGVSDRESYNQSAPGAGGYNIFDPTLSNNYKLNQLTNQLGALFNYRGDKTTLTFGAKASDVSYTQTNQLTGNVGKRSFINISPQAVFRYRFGPSTNYSFNYSGAATQPTIDQLQPIQINTDPQNISVGNANLQPSFRHNFSTSYSASKTISGQYISFRGNYSFTTNPIITSVTVDPLTGIQTNQPVNLTSKNPYNFGAGSSFSRRVLGATVELSLSASGNIGYSYNNHILSTNKQTNYNATLYLQKNEVKKYSFSVSGGPQYSIYTYSVQPASNNSPLGYNISSSGTLYLPGKFQIASDIRYSYQPPVRGVPALTSNMLNASINKTFLKGDNLKISITGNNLLNQDQVQRYPGLTSITQTSYNTIKRYFMLSVSWDFTKFGTTAEKN
ncbi:MAG: TonB-dependent receptor [Mucilaginibacter sp.]